MTILEKAYELRRQLALCESDISYSTQVSWGNNKDDAIQAMNNLIKNTIELFGTSRIDDVDYDLRDQVINDYDVKLEEALQKFPQYLENINHSR